MEGLLNFLDGLNRLLQILIVYIAIGGSLALLAELLIYGRLHDDE